MPLTITIKHGGLTCPTFICDYCRSEIDDAEEANIAWKHDDVSGHTKQGNEYIIPVVLCRDCDRNTIGTRDRNDSWTPLPAAFVYLRNNSGMTEEVTRRAERTVELFSRM
jgi:hypothetical protein